MDFEAFKSIPRLSRNCIITEKIDGANAQVCIGEDGVIQAGSRNNWITPSDDNYGFAKWVAEHADELSALGPGRHYGEWWGSGIQRRYGLTEKRFSLFNSGRWFGSEPPLGMFNNRNPLEDTRIAAPACCHVVPVLFRGLFATENFDMVLNMLKADGSIAAPGFLNPEGFMVYHLAAKQYFKKTIDRDASGKGQAE